MQKSAGSFAAHVSPDRNNLAVLLTGGGARAAYQVGLIKGIARHFPNLHFQIITGVSAGAFNAVFLASKGSLANKAEGLERVWCELTCNSIYRFEWHILNPLWSALASVFPGRKWSRPHGLLDTTPLRHLLYRIFGSGAGQPIHGISQNLRDGWLHAVSIMTMDYTTGQSVVWVQGRNIDAFQGPNRRNAVTELTIEHILASTSLPVVFPAVKIGDRWHGDGGIRLSAPLSPAIHLGASRIIAMSTGYQRTADEANTPVVEGYPPAAQIIGQLTNAVFLDVIDEDVLRLERMNDMIRKLDSHECDGFRPIELLVLRPSCDLGKLSSDYEKDLPLKVKLLTRALGAKETESPDFVSMLLFEPGYTRSLIEIGEADIETRIDEISEFLGRSARRAAAL